MLGTVMWLVVIALALALEYVGRKPRDRWPTLTDLIRRYVPRTIVAAGIVWLAWHFGVQDVLNG